MQQSWCLGFLIDSSQSRLLIAPDFRSSKISLDCNLHRCCRKTNELLAHLNQTGKAGTDQPQHPRCHPGQSPLRPQTPSQPRGAGTRQGPSNTTRSKGHGGPNSQISAHQQNTLRLHQSLRVPGGLGASLPVLAGQSCSGTAHSV